MRSGRARNVCTAAQDGEPCFRVVGQPCSLRRAIASLPPGPAVPRLLWVGAISDRLVASTHEGAIHPDQVVSTWPPRLGQNLGEILAQGEL